MYKPDCLHAAASLPWRRLAAEWRAVGGVVGAVGQAQLCKGPPSFPPTLVDLHDLDGEVVVLGAGLLLAECEGLALGCDEALVPLMLLGLL